LELTPISSQPPSEYPVAGEFREFVPTLLEVNEFALRAFREWQRRIAACMSSRGFDYAATEPVDELVFDYRRAQNPLNQQAAMQWGFHSPLRPEDLSTNTNSTPEYLDALHGSDSSSGCASDAYPKAYAVTLPLLEDGQVLVNSLDQAVSGYFATAEGISAMAAWSACLGEEGYSFASRDDAIAAYGSEERISQEELRARQSDLECDRSLGMTSGRSAWERRRYEGWVVQTEGSWSDLKHRMQTAGQELSTVESEVL
jgi:hypothetical protein